MSPASAARWRRIVGILLPLAALATEARADPSLVVAVVRPRDPGPMVTEVVTRVRGELVAAGFEVALVDHAQGIDAGAEMKAIANRLHPAAIFGIFEQTDSGAADVWIADLLTGKTLVQRVAADDKEGSPAKNGSSVQAVRAVDLLRANLLEILVERSNLPPPTPPPREAIESSRVCPCDPGAAPARGESVGLEAGTAVLHSFDGIGPSLSPILRAFYQPVPSVALRFSASGLGTRPLIEAPEGQARISQEFALFELVPVFFAERAVRPVVSIGFGAYHLQAQGVAEASYETSTRSFWAALFDVGAGVRFAASRHVGLALEVHALFTSSSPVVRIVDIEVGRAGSPSILSSLTLVATP
jgi:hypothetical protein